MKNLLIIFMVIPLICTSQEKVIGKYIGHRYKLTKNESFLNEELLLVNSGDTIRVNLKLPFNYKSTSIDNLGIFYNCHLIKDSVYTISLKKICIDDIPSGYNSYYRINALPICSSCSEFKEIQKNTLYDYKGNYTKYVDINNTLYEIIGLKPDDTCFFH